MKETFKPFGGEIDFFLRLHRHLPDKVCGESPLSPCEYREDGIPINVANDYIEELQKNPDFRQKEKEVKEAQKKGKRINRHIKV